jgi:hypothetical protein
MNPILSTEQNFSQFSFAKKTISVSVSAAHLTKVLLCLLICLWSQQWFHYDGASGKSEFLNGNLAIPLQPWTGPYGSRRLRFPEFLDNRYMKVLRLSALRTGQLYPKRYP